MPNFKTKTVRNKSPIRQTVQHEGVPVHLDPYQEQLMAAEVADKFLENFQGLVIEVEADFGAEFQDTNTGKVWIANRTGNPDEPSQVTARIYDTKTKRYESLSVENPIKAPRDLGEWAEGPMVEYTAKDGVLEALNMPGHMVEVPAYRRRQMDKNEANWFLTRVSNAAKAQNIPGYNCAVAMESRPPSNFEPDMTWALDEMRAYLRLCDPDAYIGPSEDEVTAKAKADNVPDFEWVRRLDEAKREAMKRVYFRLIDPKYKLPTRTQFNEFMAAATKVRTESVESEQPQPSA